VLAVPSAPGIAPLKKAPAEEVESYRNRILQLSVIAGPAGLPQVSFIDSISDSIDHFLLNLASAPTIDAESYGNRGIQLSFAAGEPGVILRWNFFRSFFLEIEVKSCKNRASLSVTAWSVSLRQVSLSGCLLGPFFPIPWLLEVHPLKTCSRMLTGSSNVPHVRHVRHIHLPQFC
jgi:hypothetical protein